MQNVTRNIVAGVLTIIPLYVTIWVITFVVDTLVGAGRPIVRTMARAIRPEMPLAADIMMERWLHTGFALLITLGALYLLGWATNAVVGRRILRLFHRVMDTLPLARTVYRATHTLVESLRGAGTPTGESIVLIEFPMAGRRSIGIVTRTFPATAERGELCAVYVPTTPNPTSGFVQIIPTDELIWLDWSKNDAMAFIVSGGALAPDNVIIEKPIGKPPAPGDLPSPPRADARSEVAAAVSPVGTPAKASRDA